MALIRCEDLRDILTVAWETGSRPVSLTRATARNLDEKQSVLLFNDSNTSTSAGQKSPMQAWLISPDLGNSDGSISTRRRSRMPDWPTSAGSRASKTSRYAGPK